MGDGSDGFWGGLLFRLNLKSRYPSDFRSVITRRVEEGKSCISNEDLCGVGFIDLKEDEIKISRKHEETEDCSN